MKNFLNNNSKLIICAITLIVCVAVVSVTSFSYAANNESGTIYTRDELSEQIETLTEELNSQRALNETFQNKVNEFDELHSMDTDGWIDLSSSVNMDVISTINYFRYSIKNKLLVLDFSIIFANKGTHQLVATIPNELAPVSRCVTIMTNDYVYELDSFSSGMIYNLANGSNQIWAHASSPELYYYGQMTWQIN